jgi:hypothetical protein
MGLLHLPTQLLSVIVQYVLSGDGFESLALTCKTCHALCLPFIQNHNKFNKLREHYQKFEYYKPSPGQRFEKDRLCWLLWYPDNISSAFNLIARIAAEPDIARYIEQAEFDQDCQCTKGGLREIITRSALADETPDEGREEAVIRLLANSSDLKQAGLDWKEYYAAIEEDFNTGQYSQYCAAFVLTLLPNLKRLRLPEQWNYGAFAAPDQLLDTVVSKARLPGSKSSLSQVTILEGNECDMATEFDIDMASPFLTLPYLQSFEAQRCTSADSHRNTVGEYAALENVSFRDTHLDEIAVGNFVQHTPNLKSFMYSYSGNPRAWDLCKMIKEIERGVGSHLKELYMLYESKNTMDADTGEEMNNSLAPGKLSLHGLQRIERLQLPLEIAVCNLNPATADCPASLIDLIPASVSHLSFVSYGTDDEAKTFEFLFHAFSRSQVPSLQEFHLSIPGNATELYKQSWAKVSKNMEKAGILLVHEEHDDPAVWLDRNDSVYSNDV